jgi:Mor family transcriptional regulator
MSFKTEQFQKLKDKWYKKLKKSGFEDIEKGNFLPSNKESQIQQFPPEVMARRSEYHTMATHFLETRDWGGPSVRLVVKGRTFALRLEGLSTKEVAKTVSTSRARVRTIVRNAKKWSRRDRQIWEGHVNGVYQADIAKQCRTSASTVYRTIKALRKIMLKKDRT